MKEDSPAHKVHRCDLNLLFLKFSLVPNLVPCELFLCFLKAQEPSKHWLPMTMEKMEIKIRNKSGKVWRERGKEREAGVRR